MKISICDVDYHDEQQIHDLLMLLNEYSKDPMGSNSELPQEVLERLPSALRERDFCFSAIAYVDSQPAGLINCIEGFSTFAASPLVNIHDVVVLQKYRGLGLSRALFEHVESIARERGCCKVTLEVLEGNEVAQAVYRKLGYDGYQLSSETGRAMFWQKKLALPL